MEFMIRLIGVVLDGGIIKDLHITAISRHPFLEAILRFSCCLGLGLVAVDNRWLTFQWLKLILKGFSTCTICMRLAVEWMNEIERSCF